MVPYFCESKFKIINMILSVLECLDNIDAEIFKIMVDELSNRNISWKNCIAFDSNSDNTMID